MNPDLEPTEEQRDAAALWLVRSLGRSLTIEEEARLRQWLSADLRHRKAYADAQDLWNKLGVPAQRLARARRRADQEGWFLPRFARSSRVLPSLLASCFSFWRDAAPKLRQRIRQTERS